MRSTAPVRKANARGPQFAAAAVLALTFPWVAASVSSASPLAGTRPNILLFVVDDQDKPTFSHYQPSAYLTPHFDRLAREGLLLANMHVTSTVCTPSRYSILTGRQAGRSARPASDNVAGSQRFVSFNCGMATNEHNVGRTLRDAGYRTGFIGKFHLGGEHTDRASWETDGLVYLDPNADLDNPAIRAQVTSNALSNQEILEDRIHAQGFDYVEAVAWENLDAPLDTHNPEWMVRAALDFLDQHNGAQPFFLQVNSTLMHGTRGSWRSSLEQPHISPDGWLDPVPDVSPYMPPRNTLRDRLAAAGITNVAAQDEAVGFLWSDESFGALLNKLDAMGSTVVSNTLVIWLSDHGSIYKASAYDLDGTRIPCAMRWPAGIRPGTVCHDLGQTLDLAPTFFAAAAAVVPSDYRLDGRSLLPVFEADGMAPPGWRTSIFVEIGETRAVRTADHWKYIAFRPPTNIVAEALSALKANNTNKLLDRLGYVRMNLDRRGQTDHPEYFNYDALYDLTRDPVEINNLAAHPAHQARLLSLQSLLLQGLLNSYSNRPYGEFLPGGNAADPGPPPGVLSNAFARARDLLYGTNYHPMADTNGNGLSDLWQASLPAGGSNATWQTDLDSDGNQDLMEQIYATDPLLADTPLRMRLINGRPVVEHQQLFEGSCPFQALLGSPDLVSWQPVAGETVGFSDFRIRGLRFKRLHHHLLFKDREFFQAQATHD